MIGKRFCRSVIAADTFSLYPALTTRASSIATGGADCGAERAARTPVACAVSIRIVVGRLDWNAEPRAGGGGGAADDAEGAELVERCSIASAGEGSGIGEACDGAVKAGLTSPKNRR